ncbi:MAG: sulfatase-like hydrolase/transferase [Planctomycetota bacterium]|nr:sulfatase-like hydrolase/transferase [Planctomycetota bacterium]
MPDPCAWGPERQQFIDEITCYTDVLAANGYTCGLSGKWHLGDSITPRHGMSHWFCMPWGACEYNDAEMIRDGKTQVCEGYLTDVITDDALAFIDANKSGPFYLSVHYNAPHSPWTGHPQDIVDSYDDCPFKSCPQEAAHPWFIRSPSWRAHMGNRESLKGYFAAVTAMDAGVGRIIKRLEKLGLRENTLVVFSSDNGFSCGHHGFWGKGNGTFPLNMYDNSVKVPTIFSHPGRIPAGKVTAAMVSQYDFLPTLLEYLDLPGMDDPILPGVSFAPVLYGQTDQADEQVVVFSEYGPVRMIRTPEHKYVHRYPYGPHELYDLQSDSDERNNLIDEKSAQPTVAEMRRRLSDWFARYVMTRLDGARMPVTGYGQAARIDGNFCGEGAFAPLEG